MTTGLAKIIGGVIWADDGEDSRASVKRRHLSSVLGSSKHTDSRQGKAALRYYVTVDGGAGDCLHYSRGWRFPCKGRFTLIYVSLVEH